MCDAVTHIQSSQLSQGRFSTVRLTDRIDTPRIHQAARGVPLEEIGQGG